MIEEEKIEERCFEKVSDLLAHIEKGGYFFSDDYPVIVYALSEGQIVWQNQNNEEEWAKSLSYESLLDLTVKVNSHGLFKYTGHLGKLIRPNVKTKKIAQLEAEIKKEGA